MRVVYPLNAYIQGSRTFRKGVWGPGPIFSKGSEFRGVQLLFSIETCDFPGFCGPDLLYNWGCSHNIDIHTRTKITQSPPPPPQPHTQTITEDINEYTISKNSI